MKDKKGFTLIELLAVVVILGLVILVAVPFFTGSMKVFRDDFYKSLDNTVEASGKEFFSDNRIYLPHRLLEASIVDVNTLQAEKYIKNFKDYNGNKCEENDSYVIAVKMGRDNYMYASCIRCIDDDYENIDDNPYCSDTWKDGSTQLTFSEAPTIYVYKGIERNSLKELIKVYPTISRCSKIDVSCSNPIYSVSAKDEEGVEPIYPKNIDSVNINKVGEYEVEYQFENHLETVKGKVVVYENTISNDISNNSNRDGFYFEKTNNYVRGTVNTAAVQETKAYTLMIKMIGHNKA
jgi:type IV pilus assembly protein PilA